MGGKAALRLALDLGDRISRIIAVTPVWAGAAPFDAQTLAFFRNAANDLEARAAIIGQSTGGQLPAAWTRWMAENSAEVSSTEAFATYFESWAMTDFALAAANLTQETLIVAGANDGGIPIEAINATWLANLRNARAEVLADCGHYPTLERPLALAALVERFLTQHA
jgi:pimeloyl-ACP methyl ester carboxylesterase